MVLGAGTGVSGALASGLGVNEPGVEAWSLLLDRLDDHPLI